ncbi:MULTISPECIES: sensor histidine kinase [Saccharothrix]|uniref:sensor histidine kinase n=1 Tax=Saccharothrix TaxID=2071 RepID=UPI0009FA8D6A|nr:histidine kinase [Saccharothrix sp. CB00851]
MRREFIVPDDAADEARRRLLRDLHDGLGPALAAIALGLRAARHLAVHDPAAAGPLLARLEEEVHTAVNDVRRLASGACPAVLSRLGLAGAVRAHVATLTDRHPVRVDVQCADVPDLPVGVQVAAYRIICEALTNVVRHAGARHCAVRLRFDGCLHVEVVDDGIGVGGAVVAGDGAGSAVSGGDSIGVGSPVVAGEGVGVGGAVSGGDGVGVSSALVAGDGVGVGSALVAGDGVGVTVGDGIGVGGGVVPGQGVGLGTGIGLGSMRDRAREVGGTWRVEHAAAGGTRVAADLPVAGGV